MLHEGAVADCHLKQVVHLMACHLLVFSHHWHLSSHTLAKDFLEAVR